MFAKGEKIVYGNTGVCYIEDICEKELIRNQKKLYYVLKPIYQQNNVIYAPVENGMVAMRPVMTADEAEALISKIPEIKEKNPLVNLSGEDYRNELSGHECADLVRLTSIIYEKKKAAQANNKKLGFIDEKYMRLAESLLFGELAVSLDIPYDDVPKYIEKKIKA
ncbi:MAG: hypothetical protein E7524_01120 [Ruminococcaceae bacterium]|nr:hypothetical protein [Oscillospiraceae bacterium]